MKYTVTESREEFTDTGIYFLLLLQSLRNSELEVFLCKVLVMCYRAQSLSTSQSKSFQLINSQYDNKGELHKHRQWSRNSYNGLKSTRLSKQSVDEIEIEN